MSTHCIRIERITHDTKGRRLKQEIGRFLVYEVEDNQEVICDIVEVEVIPNMENAIRGIVRNYEKKYFWDDNFLHSVHQNVELGRNRLMSSVLLRVFNSLKEVK